jgi:hypothetical protein
MSLKNFAKMLIVLCLRTTVGRGRAATASSSGLFRNSRSDASSTRRLELEQLVK